MEAVEHKKAKTHKGRLYLKDQMPKIVENPKESLFLNSDNSSEIMRMVLGDLVSKLAQSNLLISLSILAFNEKGVLQEIDQEEQIRVGLQGPWIN